MSINRGSSPKLNCGGTEMRKTWFLPSKDSWCNEDDSKENKWLIFGLQAVCQRCIQNVLGSTKEVHKQPWRRRERAENFHKQMIFEPSLKYWVSHGWGGEGMYSGCGILKGYQLQAKDKAHYWFIFTSNTVMSQPMLGKGREGLFHYKMFTIRICNDKNKGNVVSCQKLYKVSKFKILKSWPFLFFWC